MRRIHYILTTLIDEGEVAPQVVQRLITAGDNEGLYQLATTLWDRRQQRIAVELIETAVIQNNDFGKWLEENTGSIIEALFAKGTAKKELRELKRLFEYFGLIELARNEYRERA